MVKFIPSEFRMLSTKRPLLGPMLWRARFKSKPHYRRRIASVCQQTQFCVYILIL